MENDLGSFILLLAGSIFIAIGVAFFLDDQRFYREGRRITGRVKAIEKYISEHRVDGRTERRTFFRAHVDYNYNGQEGEVTSTGSNEINYKLNQALPVLVLVSKSGDVIDARIADKSYKIISIILFLIGLMTLAMYVFAVEGSIVVASVVFLIAIILGKVLAGLMEKASSLISVVQENGVSDPPEDSIMIETKADYLKEISNHSFWGNIITYSFMVASIGIIYAGYSQLPSTALEMISDDFGGFLNIITSGVVSSSWKTPLIIIGIGLFFFLASLRSAYYVRKKYGGIQRI